MLVCHQAYAKIEFASHEAWSDIQEVNSFQVCLDHGLETRVAEDFSGQEQC